MQRLRWIVGLAMIVTIFYWKILLSDQFTLLWQWELTNQSYAWFHFAATSIQHGILPIWDPYRFSGGSFIGEMQPGLFYPVKLLVYLMPLDGDGLLSVRVFHLYYVLAHGLAAAFMVLFARRIGLGLYASFVAGLSFGLGGFMARTGWPNTLDAGVWLPLVLLFFVRSLDQPRGRAAVFYGCLAGLALGMSILAGSVHLLIMQSIAVVGLAAYFGVRSGALWRSAAVVALTLTVACLFGAVQLLPTLEYTPLSLRWVGAPTPIQSLEKIPYDVLGSESRFAPRSVFAFLFGGVDYGEHAFSNYFGVMPLFLAIIGVWRCWHDPWVRYMASLALGAYIYSLGAYSLLHGALYLVPGLDIAREAGRFIYLTHFGMAVLAGFGIERLFAGDPAIRDAVRRAGQPLLAFAVVLAVAANQQTVAVAEWTYMSFLLIGASWLLLMAITAGLRHRAAKIGLVAVLLWDLYVFNWPIRDKTTAQRDNADHFQRLLDSRPLADFLRSRPGPFRVSFEAEQPPNIGDVFGVQMTGGMAATMLADYYRDGMGNQAELLNMRYAITRGRAKRGKEPVYCGGEWCVYENANAGPRAWVEADTNARIEITAYEPNRIALWVDTTGGRLVLSEVDYPGWGATVNGERVPIHKVHGFLRSIDAPSGSSQVVFRYTPRSVLLGAALSTMMLMGTAWCGWGIRGRRHAGARFVRA